jgi:phosphoglycolate phosphatase-like HAD superfamily hydrolase
MVPRPVLLLWGSDRLFASTLEADLRGLTVAVATVLGRPPVRVAPMIDRRDTDVVRETFLLNDCRPEVVADGVPRAVRHWAAWWEGSARRFGDQRVEEFPQALALVAALTGIPGVSQAVVSANGREHAQAKLRKLGVLGCFDRKASAYGEDGALAELVELAVRRSHAGLPPEFPLPQPVLITDSAEGVAAGRRAGAGVVGVATGHALAEDLWIAGAQVVLSSVPASPVAFLGQIGPALRPFSLTNCRQS